MTKVASNMTYKSVQGFSSDSTLMPFPYWYFLLGMAVVFFCFFIAYIVSYAIMSKRDDPFLLVKISKMQRVYIIICQVRVEMCYSVIYIKFCFSVLCYVIVAH